MSNSLFENIGVLECRRFGVPGCRGAGVPGCRSFGAPAEYGGVGVWGCGGAGVREYGGLGVLGYFGIGVFRYWGISVLGYFGMGATSPDLHFASSTLHSAVPNRSDTPALQHSDTPAPQHPGTQAPRHSSTPAPQHPKTPAPQNSSTPKLQHPKTPASQNSSTPKLQHPKTPAPRHSSTPALQHPNTPALQHSSTPALQHSRTLIFLILAFLAGCQPETEPQEQPGFTRERPDFTKDRSGETESAIRFTDITESAGIDFVHETGAFGEKWMPETMGSGGGFLDYDDDGLVDIFLVNSTTWPGQPGKQPAPTSKLYRNIGDDSFEDVTERAGLAFSPYGMGVAFADYDADGDADIYLTALGENKLLRNEGRRFRDVTHSMGVGGAPSDWSTSAAWVDVDRDGWLDLFVANYVQWTPETDIYVTRDGKTKSYATPEGYQGQSSRLYRNLQGRGFEDITETAGIYNNEGKSLGVAIADFNDDGWPDIVVSNDTQPNFLYMNQGNGSFVDRAIPAGIGYDEIGRARAGMGIDVADIANDGGLAIAIGNFSKEPLSLYAQFGNGELFQDRAGAARLTRPSLLALTFGLEFVDLDLDGYLDLITANGHIEPEINAVQQDITFAQNPQVFRNVVGSFVDVGDWAGAPFSKPIVGRGVASADIDGDGDLDVLITTNGGKAYLLRNDLPTEDVRWVQIQLKGRSPNLKAIGAQVTFWANGMAQRRFVRTGSSYLSQSDYSQIVFGLGEAEEADSVVVRWPTTGQKSRLTALTPGKTYQIDEE